MISSDEYQKKIVAILDNEGSKEDEKLLSAHLADCPECRAFYDEVISTRQLFSFATATKAAVTIGQDFMRTVEADARRSKKLSGEKHVRSRAPFQARLPRVVWAGGLAAAIIIAAIWLLSWSIWPRDSYDLVNFSLLTQACANEDAIFTGENIVHIENEIIVYPQSKRQSLFDQAPPADLDQQLKNDFDEPDSLLNYTWLPMCSLQANGRFRFNQLKLSTDIDQPYTVTDEAWYDPATGHFARVLKRAENLIFANSYDGEFIYTSQTAPDGTLELVKEPVGKGFRPPKKPAEFLGLSAGLRSSLQKKNLPMLQGVDEGTLEDGSPVTIFKVGTPGPFGRLSAYWLFKVRHDDHTIAENEFIMFGQLQLLTRRVLTESVPAPAISWNLAEIEGLNVITQEGPLVSITPDMVITDVSIRHMVERAKFETYIFILMNFTSLNKIIYFISIYSLIFLKVFP